MKARTVVLTLAAAAALLNKVHARLRARGWEDRREAYDHPSNLRTVLRQ